MSGEDVYDVIEYSWCDLCQAEHSPCEEPDLRYECLKCHEPIEFEDDQDGESQYHPECRPCHTT